MEVGLILTLMVVAAVVVFGLVFGVFTWVYFKDKAQVYVPSERAEVVSPFSDEVQEAYRQQRAA